MVESEFIYTVRPFPPGFVREFTIPGLSTGYQFRETRYAKLILKEAFPERYSDLLEVLTEFTIDVSELIGQRGAESTIATRFDAMLSNRSWGERTIPMSRLGRDGMIRSVGEHPIDIFGTGPDQNNYPGIALEMEWSFKPSCLDRTLLNLASLHLEGAIAVAVLITSVPSLHYLVEKMTESGTALYISGDRPPVPVWGEIDSRLNGGSVGGCPVLLVGIEPDRVLGLVASANNPCDGRNSLPSTHF